MADAQQDVWSDTILAVIDEARQDGIDLTFDVYPYTYGFTVLAYLLPPLVFEGTAAEVEHRLSDPSTRSRARAELGGALATWADVVIAGGVEGRYADCVGMDVLSAARIRGVDPVDFVCDLLVAHKLNVAIAGKPSGDARIDDDLKLMLRHPAHMLGSDGVYGTAGSHPRSYGAFARFVGRLVRTGDFLSLEEAVRHVTSFPARRWGLLDRGLIRPGYLADLVIFDPETFEDRSGPGIETHEAVGVRDVFVNGIATLREGLPTGATPGRALCRLDTEHTPPPRTQSLLSSPTLSHTPVTSAPQGLAST